MTASEDVPVRATVLQFPSRPAAVGKRRGWRTLLEAAAVALGEHRHRDALQLSDRAAQHGEPARRGAALVRGDVLLEMGDFAAALSTFDSIAELEVDDPELDCARGVALFHLVRLPEAENALRSALRGNDQLAEAYHVLGLIAELRGTGDDAELLREARRLDPLRYAVVPSLTVAEFTAVVEAAVAGLPPSVREVLHTLEICVAELPRVDELLRGPAPVSPSALAMAIRRGDAARGVQEPPRPAVLLFKRNLERAFRERETLVSELRRTLMLEVGRAVGLRVIGLAEPTAED